MKTCSSAITSFVGISSAEKDIRAWLTQQGFNGKTAEITGVELHALKRPGWLQIFRFEACCRTAKGDNAQLFGAMRSDERDGKPQIQFDTKLAVRDEQLAIWSEGLITLKRHFK